MKLTTVLASVNANPNYYLFIPKQIKFWNHFNIKFIAIFVGETLPNELVEYASNIILWNKNLDLHTAFVAQNIRIYYPALLNLPIDEMVMITDMDMLPMSDHYYKYGLENFNNNDFIYYRHIDNNEIYMCYNASHPNTWSNIFNIKNATDIENKLYETYNKNYTGKPDDVGWSVDQQIMYVKLINYPNLKILNRPIKRLEMHKLKDHIAKNESIYINNYTDSHFHRSYFSNESLILYCEKDLGMNS